MFKRLYAIGAHEDFSPTHRTRFSPRFGTASTKAWYRQYHTVVFQPIAYCPLEDLLAKYCSYIETK